MTVTFNSIKIYPEKGACHLLRSKARHPVRIVTVDDLSADWLRIKAEAEHTTPEVIIGRLVREKIAATSSV